VYPLTQAPYGSMQSLIPLYFSDHRIAIMSEYLDVSSSAVSRVHFQRVPQIFSVPITALLQLEQLPDRTPQFTGLSIPNMDTATATNSTGQGRFVMPTVPRLARNKRPPRVPVLSQEHGLPRVPVLSQEHGLPRVPVLSQINPFHVLILVLEHPF
jgi:hypothetical protein